MRKIVCPRLGGPEVLEVQEVDDIVASAGQLVIDVEAAGVNFVDALIIAGTYQLQMTPPFTPGSEIAGRIAAVADDVVGWAVGDRVLCMCGLGGYASQIRTHAMSVVRAPDLLTPGQAAAFIQSYCTALFSLRDRAHVEPGDNVLVLGAGGGVGLAAIDVAKALGAIVIAAASSDEKLAAAIAMGADHAIDYTTESLKDRARELAGGTGVDIVIDPIGGPLADAALRALGLFGRYVVIGFAAGEIPRLPLNQVLIRNRSIVGVDWGAWSMQFGPDQSALLSDALAMVADGRLHPSEPAAYPFTRAADALDDLTHRRVVGKVVLTP